MRQPLQPSRDPTPGSAPRSHLTGYQKFVVAVLAFLQFTIILDFMILSPLGAVLMPTLRITPAQFGLVVSVYALSAGASGLLAAGFADRFDRKTFLLVFYGGFIVGTLLCGLAPTYPVLLAARMVTGLFGGVIGSIVLAITADLFAFELRGRVMGYVQTAFSASQILGIPAGLYLSNFWGWHAPFLMIAGVGAAVGVLIFLYLQPVDAHLRSGVGEGAFRHLRATVVNPHYLQAFAATALMAIGGFMLMPFGSAFTVHNLGVDVASLPLVYLITGIGTIAVGPMVGRAADAFGKFRVFSIGTAIGIGMVLIYTRLGATPLPLVIAVNLLMFIGISSRMIPSQAILSAIPAAKSRGAFTAISASVQQLSGGLAAALAGAIVVQQPDGLLVHFDWLGDVVVVAALVTLAMMDRLRRYVPHDAAEPPTPTLTADPLTPVAE